MVENKEDITEAAEKMQELLRLLRQRRILQAWLIRFQKRTFARVVWRRGFLRDS